MQCLHIQRMQWRVALPLLGSPGSCHNHLGNTSATQKPTNSHQPQPMKTLGKYPKPPNGSLGRFGCFLASPSKTGRFLLPVYPIRLNTAVFFCHLLSRYIFLHLSGTRFPCNSRDVQMLCPKLGVIIFISLTYLPFKRTSKLHIHYKITSFGGRLYHQPSWVEFPNPGSTTNNQQDHTKSTHLKKNIGQLRFKELIQSICLVQLKSNIVFASVGRRKPRSKDRNGERPAERAVGFSFSGLRAFKKPGGCTFTWLLTFFVNFGNECGLHQG